MLHSSIKFVRPKPCGFARFGARQNYRPKHPARKVGPWGQHDGRSAAVLIFDSIRMDARRRKS
ncbi:hypothetical protein CDO26_31965 (plasmid) [Sinorhizobium meliloti]|nr:hypothetical protein CDO26_31965 [Sinorhizobium meliloti]